MQKTAYAGSNRKSLGNHVVSSEEEKERLHKLNSGSNVTGKLYRARDAGALSTMYPVVYC